MHLFEYRWSPASQITSRFAILGMRPLRAAALPARAAHTINFRSYQPAPQYGKWNRMRIYATRKERFLPLCNYMKINVPGRPKLHLRRVELPQM